MSHLQPPWDSVKYPVSFNLTVLRHSKTILSGHVDIGRSVACSFRELSAGSKPALSDVHVTVELQTPPPPFNVPLEIGGSIDTRRRCCSPPDDPAPVSGRTFQRLVRFGVNYDGSRVLVVTVTYTEALHAAPADEDGARAAAGGVTQTLGIGQLFQNAMRRARPVRKDEPERPSYVMEVRLHNCVESLVMMELLARAPQGESAVIGLDGHLTEEVWQRRLLRPGDVLRAAFLPKLGPDVDVKEEVTKEENLGLVAISAAEDGDGRDADFKHPLVNRE